MAVHALDSAPDMAKERQKRTDDTVRVMVAMDRDAHRRLKLYCVATSQFIEDVGARWIAERLATEEKKVKLPGSG